MPEAYDEQALERAFAEVGRFYTLTSGAMEIQINRPGGSRLAFTAFFGGAIFAAGAQRGLAPKHQAALCYVCMCNLDFGEEQAMTLVDFVLECALTGSPWFSGFEAGGDAYDAWLGGSEVKVVESLAAYLSAAPRVDVRTAPLRSAAHKAALVLD